MANLKIEGVGVRFGEFEALKDVSIQASSGEFITLLGPSGCGKTTLLKLIAGFLTPTSGRILVDDLDITALPPEKRNSAMCFQSYALFPHLTVKENLEFGLKQKRLGTSERRDRIEQVSATLGLDQQMEKLPNQLSGGQQQRVSLGRALVMRPSIILFDEPLSNLDAKLRDQVRVEIHRIQRDFGLTAVYVTHDQAEALALSDRIFVMNAGRVEQSDTPEELYYRPRTEFVADFIGDANVFEGDLEAEVRPGIWAANTPIGEMEVAISKMPKSKSIKLCWRPEYAEIGASGIEGTVVNRAFQGHFTDLTIETNGHFYRVQKLRSDAQEGDKVKIAIAPEQIVILEQENDR